MAIAAVIFAITFFKIQVSKASTVGLELTNVTTQTVILILIGLLVYHFLAFVIHAYEDFRAWELTVHSGGMDIFSGGTIELADKMRNAAKVFDDDLPPN